MSSDRKKRWSQSRTSFCSRITTTKKKKKVFRNFNTVLFFSRARWVTAALTPKPGSEPLLFHGSGDVSLPFGLYNFPCCTLGRGKRGGRITTRRGAGLLEDKWLSFHWQACLYPHLVGLFPRAEVWQSIRPPGGVWGAASSDSSLSPMCACWLTERPQRLPGSLSCSPPTGCELTPKKEQPKI